MYILRCIWEIPGIIIRFFFMKHIMDSIICSVHYRYSQNKLAAAINILKDNQSEKLKKEIKKYPMRRKSNSVCIEGLDGLGKETTSFALYEKINNRYVSHNSKRRAHKVSYPTYHQWQSKLVRLYLKGFFNEDPMKVNPKLASFFYAFDRFVTYHRTLKKYYRNGDYIIYDRYTFSNIYFQAIKNMDDSQYNYTKFALWCLILEFYVFGIPVCDRIIYLTMADIDYRKYVLNDKTNLEARNKNGEGRDIHENSKMQLQAKKHAAVLNHILKAHVILCADYHRRYSTANIVDHILKVIKTS